MSNDDYYAWLYHDVLPTWPVMNKLAPEVVVLHDREEDREAIGPSGWLQGELSGTDRVGMLGMRAGFVIHDKRTTLPGKTRAERPSTDTEILAVLAPPYNAIYNRDLVLMRFGEPSTLDRRVPTANPLPEDSRAYVSDHRFERRTPAPGDGGDDVIKRALAHCKGCVARGYHLPETEIRCHAFGVSEPPRPDTSVNPWAEGMARLEEQRRNEQGGAASGGPAE